MWQCQQDDGHLNVYNVDLVKKYDLKRRLKIAIDNLQSLRSVGNECHMYGAV